jgi:hypothetical protein
MALSNIFNKKGPRTSSSPIGEVLHIGERPWDNFDWTTDGHPVYFRMEKNKHGSYDIVQKLQKRKYLPHKCKDVNLRHLSEREALNQIFWREVEHLRKFGGYSKSLTYKDISDLIQTKKYPRNHIFTYAKNNPEALQNWIKDNIPQASKPAPKGPGV